MDETHAIKLCINYQDPRGFEFLVKKYRKEAFFHAVSLLGNSEDAADACQESFTRAFIAIPKLNRLERFYPWFYRILRNCCLNLLRRRKVSIKHKQSVLREESSNPVSETNPNVILEKKEEEQTVWKALEELNIEFREILVMKYIQGWNYDEISEHIGIPRGTVMSRLYYARKAFRKKYIKIKKNEES